MKVSDNYKSCNKKAISFNTTETNDKIDEPTSLVSKRVKWKYKWTSVIHNLNHKYIKVKEGDRIDAAIIKIITGQGIDHLVDRNTSYRGRGNFGRNYRQNYRGRS